jgi:hypothetical protein
MILTKLIHRLEPIIFGLVIAIVLAFLIRYQSWLVLSSIVVRIWSWWVHCTKTMVSLAKIIVSSKIFYGFVSILVGLLIGILFHYLIYRFTLPSKPFVYAAF